LDIIVEADENVYPMIPASACYRNIIMGAEDKVAIATGKQGPNI
jgi:acetolactate synthase-1/2/3 large subunit